MPVAAGQKRTLSVVADNGTTKAVSDAVEVTGADPAPKPAPAAPVPVPGAAPEANGKALHVLAFGVNDYPGDMKLKCAVADATGLCKTLKANARPLFKRGVVTELKTDAQATRAGMLAALDALKTRVRDNDVTVVFYAGHGDAAADGKYYLLSHGCDDRRLAETAVSGDEFKEKLKAVPGSIIVVFDACHAASLKDKGLRRGNQLEHSLQDEECGVIVMSAVSLGQLAEERDGHGLFTKAMMDGAGGGGPAEHARGDPGRDAAVVRHAQGDRDERVQAGAGVLLPARGHVVPPVEAVAHSRPRPAPPPRPPGAAGRGLSPPASHRLFLAPSPPLWGERAGVRGTRHRVSAANVARFAPHPALSPKAGGGGKTERGRHELRIGSPPLAQNPCRVPPAACVVSGDGRTHIPAAPRGPPSHSE